MIPQGSKYEGVLKVFNIKYNCVNIKNCAVVGDLL
jgi:hypothetical protein